MYSARRQEGTRWRFGSSGLLYRSNKLMFDRATLSLWSSLTGEPVAGPLAGAAPALTILPAVVSSWGAWRSRHPETRVMRLPAALGDRFGFAYEPGAADRARRGVSFPVWLRDRRLDPRTEILGVRLGGAAKAFRVDDCVRAGLVHDDLAGVPLLVVAEPSSGVLRVYRRPGRRFTLDAAGHLLDEAGRRWRVTEEFLEPPPGSGELPAARLPAQHASWSGWFAFFPSTELGGAEAESTSPAGSEGDPG